METNKIKRTRIKRITIKPNEDVYDIAVEKNHNFFANGILVHNCNEIALRNNQMCNLTELNVSDIVSQDDLNDRARAASIIGTLQTTYTDFHYLRPVWQRNTERDALLGVSMTGIGSGVVLGYDIVSAATIVKETNIEFAEKVGVNPAARLTCVKPSGTSSLVLKTSSGIHAWFAKWYIRRMRVAKNEAIYQHLIKHHPELVEDEFFSPHDTAIIQVPQRAPKGAILRDESPFDLLERIKIINSDWINPGHVKGANHHNISATVSVKEDQWSEIFEWLWKNRECYNGISLLPFDGGSYVQAPFEECTEEKYNELMKTLTKVDLTKVIELDDNTDLSGELACSGGACEIV